MFQHADTFDPAENNVLKKVLDSWQGWYTLSFGYDRQGQPTQAASCFVVSDIGKLHFFNEGDVEDCLREIDGLDYRDASYINFRDAYRNHIINQLDRHDFSVGRSRVSTLIDTIRDIDCSKAGFYDSMQKALQEINSSLENDREHSDLGSRKTSQEIEDNHVKLTEEADSVLQNILSLKEDSLLTTHDVDNHTIIENPQGDRHNPEYGPEIFAQAVAYALTNGSSNGGTEFYSKSFSVKRFCDRLFGRKSKGHFEDNSSIAQHQPWIEKIAQYLGEPEGTTLKQMQNKYLTYEISAQNSEDPNLYQPTEEEIKKECQLRFEKHLRAMHKEWKTDDFDSSLSHPFLKTIDDSIQVFLKEASYRSWELGGDDTKSQEYDDHIVSLLNQMLEKRYQLMTFSIEQYLRKKAAYNGVKLEKEIQEYIANNRDRYLVPFKAKAGMLVHYDIKGFVSIGPKPIKNDVYTQNVMIDKRNSEIAPKDSLIRLWERICLKMRLMVEKYEAKKYEAKKERQQNSVQRSLLSVESVAGARGLISTYTREKRSSRRTKTS